MTFIAPVYRLPLCILVRSLYGSMSPPLIPLSWYFLPSRWRFRSLSPAYHSVVGGLLISLLVIPCISAGTLAISVGSKVILSNLLWFPDDNISVTLLFFGCCINRTLLCPGSSNVCTPSSCLYQNMTKLSLMFCPLSTNHSRTPMGGEHAR